MQSTAASTSTWLLKVTQEPKLSAETFSPEPPRRRYGMSMVCSSYGRGRHGGSGRCTVVVPTRGVRAEANGWQGAHQAAGRHAPLPCLGDDPWIPSTRTRHAFPLAEDPDGLATHRSVPAER